MSFDVVGIGNAIVDVIAPADDSFLDLMGIGKGIMQLVERERGELLYAAMKDRVQAPGLAVAVRWDGRELLTAPATVGEPIVIPARVEPGRHLLEVIALGGPEVEPGGVRLLAGGS